MGFKTKLQSIILYMVWVTYVMINPCMCFGQDTIDSIASKRNKNSIQNIPPAPTTINQEKDIETLQKLITQSNQVISNQSALISSFGTIYTILTIIITIVAVGIPILVYQVSIKPSRELLSNLENNLDKKVEVYLKETRTNQINQAIANLRGESAELKAQAVSFLSLTQYQGFSDQEMFELYRLVKSGNLSTSHLTTVVHLLISRVNTYADELCNDIKVFDSPVLKPAAYMYFFKAGIKNYLPILKEYIQNSTKQNNEYLSLLAYANMISVEQVKYILNCKELINILDGEALKNLDQQVRLFLDSHAPSVNLEETYLYDKISSSSI